MLKVLSCAKLFWLREWFYFLFYVSTTTTKNNPRTFLTFLYCSFFFFLRSSFESSSTRGSYLSGRKAKWISLWPLSLFLRLAAAVGHPSWCPAWSVPSWWSMLSLCRWYFAAHTCAGVIAAAAAAFLSNIDGKDLAFMSHACRWQQLSGM